VVPTEEERPCGRSSPCSPWPCPSGSATLDPQPAANRGSTLKIDKATGKASYVAGGLRTPNGLGWGPEGDLFVTDNQGAYLPTSKLVRIKQGRFFNHHTNPDGPFDDRPVTQPILWLPHGESRIRRAIRWCCPTVCSPGRWSSAT
jgi:hypothetical protein